MCPMLQSRTMVLCSLCMESTSCSFLNVRCSSGSTALVRNGSPSAQHCGFHWRSVVAYLYVCFSFCRAPVVIMTSESPENKPHNIYHFSFMFCGVKLLSSRSKTPSVNNCKDLGVQQKIRKGKGCLPPSQACRLCFLITQFLSVFQPLVFAMIVFEAAGFGERPGHK